MAVSSFRGPLLPHVFDSAGSAGVVFGLTRVVIEAFLYFRCFVSSFASALLEFMLLWLVRDWLSLLSLVREAHPPTLFRYGLAVVGVRCRTVVVAVCYAVRCQQCEL
ncbi:hypothetical protein Taro_043405 [Colocasia esculenta]|uniref:Uncharacterized protein n=1 Tax=Colocasia esculenta TaxID=4460 RepID=A0A843WJC3_COLES|nr:hypothetical protein [Colocasia esculenta]